MRTPTGRVQGTNRPVVLREGVVVTGRKPLVVVELKVESRRNVKAIEFWSWKLGIDLQLCQEIAPGSLEAYTATGAPDALERFLSFPFVASFHLPVAWRVGWQGQGGGELKPRHVQASIRERAAWGPKRREPMPIAPLDRMD
jgi:hypothetical protein